MARPITVWVAATLGVCAIVAVAYIPPRGSRASRRENRFYTQFAGATPARVRAQALAEEWRAAHQARRLLEGRTELQARLQRAPRAGPMLLIAGSDSVAALLAARVGPKLDSAWHDLGLNETKISIGLLVDSIPSSEAATPLEASSITYLLPDTSNRTLCVARVVENLGWRNAILRGSAGPQDEWLRRWLKGLLGPCAFFAAYGTPSKSVRSWLENRGFDLALYPNWDESPSSSGSASAIPQLGSDRRWSWEYIYHQSFPAVACIAGRASGCREAVLAGAGDERQPSLPSIIATDRGFWRRQRLISSTTYLSRVAHEIGRDRFLEFWTSPLPVDSALSRALRQPVGDWTAAWQRRLLGGAELRLGAGAPLSSSLLAVLLAAVAVATVAVTVRRREIR